MSNDTTPNEVACTTEQSGTREIAELRAKLAAAERGNERATAALDFILKRYCYPDGEPREDMPAWAHVIAQLMIGSDPSRSPWFAELDRQERATPTSPTVGPITVLPDGHAFTTMSFPLPADHWLTQPGDNVPPMPWRVGTGEVRTHLAEAIRGAARYAIRATTNNGAEDDYDPDAMVQNFVVGLLGYWTEDGTSAEPMFNPSPLPAGVSPVAPQWKPIASAPRDNTRLLALAQFGEDGELVALGWDGVWESDSGSWEMPEVYYFWATALGSPEEPTHWAYQDEPLPPLTALAPNTEATTDG